MAGKVSQEAEVKNKKVIDIKPREMTTQEIASAAASEAVAATMREFMPMFGEILKNVTEQKQNPAQAQAQVQEDYRSVQSKVIQEINQNYNRRISDNKRFLAKMYNSPKSDYVVMRIPRVYAKYFGSQLPVGLNGSTIQVPVNGQSFRVHKLYVPIIEQALEYKDQKVAFMEDTDFQDIAEVPEVGSLGNM